MYSQGEMDEREGGAEAPPFEGGAEDRSRPSTVPAEGGESMTKVEDLLTSSDVADLVGVKVETIYHYKAQGKMPEPTIAGREPRWDRKTIERWAERRRSNAGKTEPDGT
jgi:predicted DNA-binding transcriptional regulator AlpA